MLTKKVAKYNALPTCRTCRASMKCTSSMLYVDFRSISAVLYHPSHENFTSHTFDRMNSNLVVCCYFERSSSTYLQRNAKDKPQRAPSLFMAHHHMTKVGCDRHVPPPRWSELVAAAAIGCLAYLGQPHPSDETSRHLVGVEGVSIVGTPNAHQIPISSVEGNHQRAARA